MKKKLALLFFIVVLIPFLLSMKIVESIFNFNFETMLQKKAEQSYETCNELLDNFLTDTAVKARISISNPDIQTLIANEKNIELIDKITTLKSDLNLKKWGACIEVFDSKGALLASVPSAKKVHTSPDIVKSVLAGALREKLFIEAENSIQAMSAYPVYIDDSAEPIGVLSFIFPFSDFMADHLSALTGSHIIFAKPQKDNFTPFASSLILDSKRVYAPLTLKNEFCSGSDIYSDYYLYSRLTKKISSSFSIFLLLEKSPFTNIIRSTKNALTTVIIITLLFAIISSFIFTILNITGPVNRLVTAAKELEKGNFDNSISIKSKDEFSFLGDTFESMRIEIKSSLEKLDSRVRELTLLDEINRVLVQYRDDSAVKEVLIILCRAMGAKRCSILMMDKELQELSLKMFYSENDNSSDEPQREYIRFKPGQGLAGLAAQKGEIQVSDNTDDDDRFKDYDESKTTDKSSTLICLPLMDDKECLGVINISDSAVPVKEPAINVLKNAAHQISMAMQKARLYELAITDGMTKLFIHRYFQARLETELQRSKRYNTKTGLIMFDIDHFKNFNDTWGHQLGDTVLKRVANIFKQGIREGIDIPARYGGEEFAVIMPEAELSDAVFVAERLRKMVEDDFIIHKGHEIRVKISLGCAVYPDNADNKTDLIKQADLALYRSKENGRNCVSSADLN